MSGTTSPYSPTKTDFSEMSSSVYSPIRTGFREKRRMSVSLPTPAADFKKLSRRPQPLPWMVYTSLRIPGSQRRRIRVFFLNPERFRIHKNASCLCPRGITTLLLIFLFAFVFTVLGTRWRSGRPSTLVFPRADLQRIWRWEIASGHYPSGQPIPKQIGLTTAPQNPALAPLPPLRREQLGPPFVDAVGVGARRIYPDIHGPSLNAAYPPRPTPGSVADLDVVMEHCDFAQQKYVRDCLEVLRVGGRLDTGKRFHQGGLPEWKYMYLEEGGLSGGPEFLTRESQAIFTSPSHSHRDDNTGLAKKRGAQWEPSLTLPVPRPHRPYSTLSQPCDEDNPRIFHMFWAGSFTDKPYLALLSFLFTQNVRIFALNDSDAPVCRPQFWLWINPGPAASVPNPTATRDMFEQLKTNPWASPFLHPRFHDVIKFKLWNTTEQLDGVPEIKDEWRTLKDGLFNSGGHIIVPSSKSTGGNQTSRTGSDDMLSRTGSKSSASYDKLSTVLSDMVRFVLCHRFGGIYLDADTIFLRDWEDLWGWKGAFAYRWSRLEKYNTAVLRMNKGSALGSFLFRTALRNGLDFHPMTVSRYTKDAYLEGLLLRLPDALFDAAWLNTEMYQRDRPPQPYFTEFAHFFDTPAQDSAAPQALGFDGFFKGAYSYHYHNSWWKPSDPTRNWPDLGSRFKAGEETARALAAAAAQAAGGKARNGYDKRDLDWVTVMKRTFESYVRGERPNMYGEWVNWS